MLNYDARNHELKKHQYVAIAYFSLWPMKSNAQIQIFHMNMFLWLGTPKINDNVVKVERFNEIFGIAYSNSK